MRPGYRTHAIGSGLIVQQDATATVHLQVYETGRHETAGGNTRLRPVRGNLARRREAGNPALLNHHGGVAMPAAAVKYTVGKNGP